MSSYSREIHYATRLLCANKGSMVLVQLLASVLQHCDVTEDRFWYMVKNCPRFVVVPSQEETSRGDGMSSCTVVAKTSLRLCKKYSKEDCGSCQELHLCKYFIYGNCRFGKGRKPCKFSHDIRSDHNFRVLRECTLHELNEDELFLLLLQNDPALLPEVCVHYNKGSGLHGACTFQENCTKVHMCMHFLQGNCMFGRKCKRQHDVDQRGRRMLEERGLSGGVIHDLPYIYQNILRLSRTPPHSPAAQRVVPPSSVSDAENPAAPLLQSPAQMDKTEEICLHHLRRSCKFQDQCIRVHFHLPYKWEAFDGEAWKELQDVEEIERDFCDPHKTQSSGTPPVDFLSMTRAWQPVRRLSTVSSVTKPPHYVLTTEWRWYYKGEQGEWVEYGQPDDKQRTTSMTSHELEEAYTVDSTAEVMVVKGHRQYYISFQDMYQRNPKHNTKRRVRRRPRFVSATDVERQAAR